MNRRQLFASIGATAIAAAIPKPIGVATAIRGSGELAIKPRMIIAIDPGASDKTAFVAFQGNEMVWPKRNFSYGDMYAEIKARYPQL